MGGLHLLLSINIHNIKIGLTVYYRSIFSCTTNFIKEVAIVLNSDNFKYQFEIIAGDFNINLIENNFHTNENINLLNLE